MTTRNVIETQLWDIRKTNIPFNSFPILGPYSSISHLELYENDKLFDQFDCKLNSTGR